MTLIWRVRDHPHHGQLECRGLFDGDRERLQQQRVVLDLGQPPDGDEQDIVRRQAQLYPLGRQVAQRYRRKVNAIADQNHLLDWDTDLLQQLSPHDLGDGDGAVQLTDASRSILRRMIFFNGPQRSVNG